MTPKSQNIKLKNWWTGLKAKTFPLQKTPIRKLWDEPVDDQKLSVNHISDKGLVCGIYKELLQLNSK